MHANAIAKPEEQDDEVGANEPTAENLRLIEQEEREEEKAGNMMQKEGSKFVREPLSAFSIYFRDLYEGHLLTAEQEKVLAKKKETGDSASREELIVCNLRLVVKIAKRYARKKVQFLDLIQEGNWGLIRGIDRFKSSGGYRVSTYVTWWIQQAIDRGSARQSRTIRASEGMELFRRRRRKAIKQLLEVLKRLPEREELVQYMYQEDLEAQRAATGGPLKDRHADRLLRVLQKKLRLAEEVEARERAISLEWLIEEGENGEFRDFLEDVEGDLEAKVQHAQEVERALQLLGTLTASEQEVLRLRFGLGGTRPPQTLEAIGAQRGLSRERIRQIEAKALERIRNKWQGVEHREKMLE